MFPTKMMIPPGKGIKKCKCGNVFRVVSLESRNPVIHHSKPTYDSRTGNLTLHFLETCDCDCKKFYHGENDKLVRTSAAPSSKRSNVNFVSVDLLNEYLASLFWEQPGGKIDAFVTNKNALNCDERGEVGEISKKEFLKAFKIYIHATNYNTEDAFVCNQCPGELRNGEKEGDFENKRGLHICDGIDMGNMQYATKGMVEKDRLLFLKTQNVDSEATPFLHV